MRSLAGLLFLGIFASCRAADLANLPANTWVPLKYSTEQPADPECKGRWAPAGWNKKEQASGMFCYNPRKDAWYEIKPANPFPPHRGWFGWMKLCYDSHHDCFIGMIGDAWFAFRHVP